MSVPNRVFAALPRRTSSAAPAPAPAGTPPRRLHLNECPYPPSPAAVAAMQAACAHGNRYPDPYWRDLAAAVAARTGVPAERIVFGNGSDELIVNAAMLALEPGDEVLVPFPSFPGYDHCASVAGAAIVAVPVRDDGAPDVDAMLEAVGERTRIVFCCTPNNPTGAMLPAADVERLALGVPASALLVVDEAYHEFAIHAGGDQHLEVLAARRGPWASFRTMSKAYAMAGIRVGYALLGSEDLAASFQSARAIFNVGVVAQAGALAAFADREHVRWILDRTAEERGRIAAGLERLGCRPLPSVANFVTARTPRDARALIADLAGRGVLVRPVPARGYEQHVRITVGTAEDTDAFLEALEAVLAR